MKIFFRGKKPHQNLGGFVMHIFNAKFFIVYFCLLIQAGHFSEFFEFSFQKIRLQSLIFEVDSFILWLLQIQMLFSLLGRELHAKNRKETNF